MASPMGSRGVDAELLISDPAHEVAVGSALHPKNWSVVAPHAAVTGELPILPISVLR